MRDTLRIAWRVSFVISTAALLIAGGTACIETRTYDIRVRDLPGLEWNGNLRIVEDHYNATFLGSEHRRVRQVELLGAAGRAVVVHGWEHSAGNTCVVAYEDRSADPLQVVAAMVVDDRRGGERGGAGAPLDEPQFQSMLTEIRARRFDDVSYPRLALLAASTGRHVESVYQLDTDLRIRIRRALDGRLSIAIETNDGRVLHVYEPHREIVEPTKSS